ncbi:hypothetical protein Pcinc_018201 [Petrolisthes cinctipes]|uniref:Uncharacterized protein n=1 Tax=Petrolisthes cinctipes TaxID=88211 RepID=A0AAE1FNH2_PETCI|nr:hypothetical protein Pcinc_028960 [Petrolisthes cinctipes]KAK3877069.1 hypothetical protein Pcinc_018201 [Petrolisthes cinctipes]
MNYWERLKHLKLFSLQRRRERYQTIYTWRTLEGLVPNIGIQLGPNQTRGRTCYIEGPKTNFLRMKTLRANTFSKTGHKLFNSLPLYLRNMSACSVDVFKRHFDNFLQKILYQTHTLCPRTRRDPTTISWSTASHYT